MKTSLGAIAIAAAVVISAALFTHAFRTRTRANHHIALIGSGTRDFDADLVSWKANFTRKDMDLKLAYNALNDDRAKIHDFLVAHGAAEKDLVFSSISIEKEMEETIHKDESKTSRFTGYRLTQSVQVEVPGGRQVRAALPERHRADQRRHRADVRSTRILLHQAGEAQAGDCRRRLEGRAPAGRADRRQRRWDAGSPEPSEPGGLPNHRAQLVGGVLLARQLQHRLPPQDRDGYAADRVRGGVAPQGSAEETSRGIR